jgi:hypothetical protein
MLLDRPKTLLLANLPLLQVLILIITKLVMVQMVLNIRAHRTRGNPRLLTKRHGSGLIWVQALVSIR